MADVSGREAFLPGFEPLNALWGGDHPPYPSGQSARWALRTLRPALVQARAIALHRGRYFVHLGRMADIVQNAALEAAAAQGCGSADRE